MPDPYPMRAMYLKVVLMSLLSLSPTTVLAAERQKSLIGVRTLFNKFPSLGDLTYYIGAVGFNNPQRGLDIAVTNWNHGLRAIDLVQRPSLEIMGSGHCIYIFRERFMQIKNQSQLVAQYQDELLTQLPGIQQHVAVGIYNISKVESSSVPLLKSPNSTSVDNRHRFITALKDATDRLLAIDPTTTTNKEIEGAVIGWSGLFDQSSDTGVSTPLVLSEPILVGPEEDRKLLKELFEMQIASDIESAQHSGEWIYTITLRNGINWEEAEARLPTKFSPLLSRLIIRKPS